MKKIQKDSFGKVKLPSDAVTCYYRLVIGGHWQHDFYNKVTESNPYGELKSVLKVN
jgi:hypothetical protein